MRSCLTCRWVLHIAGGALGVLGFVAHVSAMSLEDAVSHTLITNPEILAAKNERQARTYEVKQARADYLPSVSLDAGVGHETRTAPATEDREQDSSRREFGLHASQTVFDGFATSAEVNRQKARLESASYQEFAIAEQLALKTAEVYMAVLKQAKLLDLARSSLWEHQNIYDQMKLRKETGVGSKADLDQIAARLALANANMIVAQNNLVDAQSNYFRNVGLFPNLDNMSLPEMAGNLPESKEQALMLALDKHPTLKSASSDVNAAMAQHEASKSTYWPKVSVEVDKRWDENVGTIQGEDEDFVVALRLSYDLFRGGKNRSRSKQTAYLIEEAKDIRNLSRRQVTESMSLSWNAYEALSAQMKYLEQHVTAAKSTKSAYGKQFNIGKRTLLDLLNTETEVVESERAYTNAKYERLYTSYRILNAAGALVSSFNVPVGVSK